MRILPYIILVFSFIGIVFPQSPHGSSFKLDCSECHSEKEWTPISANIKFQHNTTVFELTGQHKTLNCISCHETLVFSNGERSCLSCHKDIHQNSVSKDCADCHNTASWNISNITEMHQRSRFPLVGSHLAADCSQCHLSYSNRVFEPLNVDCYNCHKTDYANTVNPNHKTVGLSTDCKLCHSINQVAWTNSSFVHDIFPLIGGHKINDCFLCHSQSSFIGLSKDCYECHKSDYVSAANPEHLTANFEKDCKACHSINSWVPATFDHNITRFPLTGKHTSASCQSCHSGGYSGTAIDCYSCHRSDYENPLNDPNHITANFSQDCKSCHSTNGWEPATFDHNTTQFPLTGKHTTVSCQSCHSSGYSGTALDCYTCHRSDYERTTNNPNHIASNFPTECLSCHTTNGWTPSTFNHDGLYFPIYSGKHRNEWTNCTDCHRTPNDFTTFSCIDCHEHRKTKMDSEHNGVSGYSYNSNACLTCHPNGREDRPIHLKRLGLD
ncbi:MAG: hypothetical protein Q8N03_02065 [Ignavibacteria bacterium]|nr:hypothetical protein [Ignavibacteria bacterium]